MKFTVQKSVFLSKLTPAMGTVSNKNTITSIEGVLFESLDNGRIQISTYDMNKGVRCTFTPTEIERPGSFIINAQRLYQTVRVLPDDEITFDVSDQYSCKITCGKSSFSMFAIAGVEFPSLPELTTDRGFEIEASLLRSLIEKVQHSVAEQDNRPMLCGAFFKISGNEITVVSCDSYTLSIMNHTCEISSVDSDEEIDCSFIIPGHALGEINKIIGDAKDGEKIRISLSRKHAILSREDMILFTRTIDSEYIDYERIMPKENDIFVTVDRETFLSGLERANIIAEEKIQGSGRSYVKIILEDQKLVLTSNSVNGNVSDEMDCVHEGGDLEIGFNCRYLINSVKAATGENLLMTFKTATSAITIEPAEKDENSNFFYMILPVRMNQQEK